jgi:hypothetical protein
LATLAFDCDFQQINNVIIVKYKCGPAQSARASKGTSFVIRLGHGLSPTVLRHINTDQGRGLAKATKLRRLSDKKPKRSPFVVVLPLAVSLLLEATR